MNERQILKNLFREEEPITWFGTVVKRISRQRYDVQELGSDKVVTVDCDPALFYPPGAQVIVENGRIIGSGQLQGEHRIYEV